MTPRGPFQPHKVRDRRNFLQVAVSKGAECAFPADERFREVGNHHCPWQVIPSRAALFDFERRSTLAEASRLSPRLEIQSFPIICSGCGAVFLKTPAFVLYAAPHFRMSHDAQSWFGIGFELSVE